MEQSDQNAQRKQTYKRTMSAEHNAYKGSKKREQSRGS